MLSDYKQRKLMELLARLKAYRDDAADGAEVSQRCDQADVQYYEGEYKAFQTCYEQLKAILEE